MKKSQIAQWIIAAVFALCAVGNGFHWTTILILLASFLMMPISKVREFINSLQIKNDFIIILSVVFLIFGAIFAPLEIKRVDDTSDPNFNIALKETGDDPEPDRSDADPNNNTSSDKETNGEIENTDSKEDREVWVWISTHGGTKYHTKPDCSNMKAPEKITKTEAVQKGFQACKRC